MSKWLARGLVFAALVVLIRLIKEVLTSNMERYALHISLVALTILVLVAVLWGLRDGRADARENPDPDRREDLAMTWLVAGLVAGLVSGAVCWLISFAYPQLYVQGLFGELTTFAAFIALVVFLPAMLGVVVGRVLIDRKGPPAPQHGHVHDEDGEERADTDVFAAVQDDQQTR